MADLKLNGPSAIERTIAITEITRILHKYCILAREDAPFATMADLFVPHTGQFQLPDGTAVPPQEMGGVVKGNPPAFIRHHLTSLDIDFTSDNEAKTKAYFFAVTKKGGSGGPSGAGKIDHSGYWEDVFENLEHGQWLIKNRRIVVETWDANGWYASAYH